jgi:hypothetical protein
MSFFGLIFAFAYDFKIDFFVDSLSGFSFNLIGRAIYRKGDFTGFHVVPGQISLPQGVRQ